MLRAARMGLLAAYALSLALLCLCPCPSASPAKADAHGCCPSDGTALSAAASDCCGAPATLKAPSAVTTSPVVADAAILPVAFVPAPPARVASHAALPGPLRAGAPPPTILRI